MAAGDWEYHGVSEWEEPETGNFSWLVEARRPRPRTDWYVRLLMWCLVDLDDPADEMSPVKAQFDVVDPTGYLAENHGSAPFSPVELRDVPYRRLLSQATLDAGRRESDYRVQNPPDFKALRAEWPKGDTDEVARWAGWVYKRAVADGQPATKAVEDAFGVSRSTAKRMVALARELGFIADHVVGAPGPTSRKGPTNEQGTT
ncbi:hypothetical protein [Corynebacterium nuruki]|uniref:hypothetical protein n=1 Tax=Corynebacterium nuruki TaxID=1032851 RepID=UPI0039BF1A16